LTIIRPATTANHIRPEYQGIAANKNILLLLEKIVSELTRRMANDACCKLDAKTTNELNSLLESLVGKEIPYKIETFMI
jgi:hypothetical protein